MSKIIAFAAHPEKGNTVLDLILPNTGPIAPRLLQHLETNHGEGWTLIDWVVTGAEA